MERSHIELLILVADFSHQLATIRVIRRSAIIPQTYLESKRLQLIIVLNHSLLKFHEVSSDFLCFPPFHVHFPQSPSIGNQQPISASMIPFWRTRFGRLSLPNRSIYTFWAFLCWALVSPSPNTFRTASTTASLRFHSSCISCFESLIMLVWNALINNELTI